MRRSSVPSLSLQLVFPAPTLERKCQTRVKKWQDQNVQLCGCDVIDEDQKFYIVVDTRRSNLDRASLR